MHPKTQTLKKGHFTANGGVPLKSKKKRERRTTKFKERAVPRMLAGEPISELSRELKVRWSLLYRWRDAYRQEGVAGFRSMGRPGWSPEKKAQEAEASSH